MWDPSAQLGYELGNGPYGGGGLIGDHNGDRISKSLRSLFPLSSNVSLFPHFFQPMIPSFLLLFIFSGVVMMGGLSQVSGPLCGIFLTRWDPLCIVAMTPLELVLKSVYYLEGGFPKALFHVHACQGGIPSKCLAGLNWAWLSIKID